MREPPTEVHIVLPVWGARYIAQFLDLCLPTLLAPGNIPALARMAPCTFVLMTRGRAAGSITSHPLWALLASHCAVKIVLIDDLISRSSSTVLTLAYCQAIRAQGRSMRDTCFMLLVSDYVVADGSLSNAATRIFSGASGVLAGNFQISAEATQSQIKAAADPATGVIALAPRELAGLALRHLHPATEANIVEGTLVHDPQANRMFWRAGEACMIGRFFLMHMIAIRPEVSEFIVTAPSDYALIPELCPSGAVVAITDSDDYMTVECQPKAARLPPLAFGPLTARRAATSLQAWATRQHHDNIRGTLVFHSGDCGPEMAEAAAKADAFVAAIYAVRKIAPQPHRGHPLWRRALDHHLATADHPLASARLAELTGEADGSATSRKPGSLRRALLGRAPDLRPWHPRYVDAARVMSALAELARGSALLILSQASAAIRAAFDAVAGKAGAASVTHADPDDVTAQAGDAQATAFDACLVLWPDMNPAGLDRLLTALDVRLTAQARVIVVFGEVFGDDVGEVPPDCFLSRNQGGAGLFTLERIDGVSVGAWRTGVQRTMMRFARMQAQSGVISRLFAAGAAALLAPLSFTANFAASRANAVDGERHCSSLLLFLRRTKQSGGRPAGSGADAAGIDNGAGKGMAKSAAEGMKAAQSRGPAAAHRRRGLYWPGAGCLEQAFGRLERSGR